VLYLIFVLRGGYRQYIHHLPMWGTRLYAAAYLASGFALLTAQLTETPRNFGNAVLEILILFVIILCFLNVVCRLRPRITSREFDRETIKTIEYMMCANEDSIEGSGSDNQILIAGLLRLHEQVLCENPRCFTLKKHLEKHYDESDSLDFAGSFRNNSLRLKLLLKCHYKSLITANPSNSEYLIDYLEFISSQIRSEHLACEILLRLHTLKLGFFERIKVETIFEVLRERRRMFNKQLYDAKMDIESVLEAEKSFENAMNTTEQYLRGQR
jgi:hypothetical protein